VEGENRPGGDGKDIGIITCKRETDAVWGEVCEIAIDRERISGGSMHLGVDLSGDE
jgi:hypothetical protein